MNARKSLRKVIDQSSAVPSTIMSPSARSNAWCGATRRPRPATMRANRIPWSRRIGTMRWGVPETSARRVVAFAARRCMVPLGIGWSSTDAESESSSNQSSHALSRCSRGRWSIDRRAATIREEGLCCILQRPFRGALRPSGDPPAEIHFSATPATVFVRMRTIS